MSLRNRTEDKNNQAMADGIIPIARFGDASLHSLESVVGVGNVDKFSGVIVESGENAMVGFVHDAGKNFSLGSVISGLVWYPDGRCSAIMPLQKLGNDDKWHVSGFSEFFFIDAELSIDSGRKLTSSNIISGDTAGETVWYDPGNYMSRYLPGEEAMEYAGSFFQTLASQPLPADRQGLFPNTIIADAVRSQSE